MRCVDCPVISALQGVLTLLLMILVGVLLRVLKIIPEEVEGPLNSMTMKIAIPCVIYLNAVKYITPDFLHEMGFWLLLPAGLILSLMALGLLLIKVFRIDERNRGVFLVMFSLSNAIMIGLPVNVACFGEDCMPYVIAYFLPNTIIFWTIGNMLMAHDGGQKIRFDLNTMKNLLSPPVCGLIIGVIISFSGIILPDFLNSAIKQVGNVAVPMSLFLTGMALAKMGRKAFKLSKEGFIILGAKMLLAPAVCLAVLVGLGAGTMMTAVYTMESAMPVMNQSVILARHYGANYRLSAQMLTVTTLFSIVFVPLLVFVMSVVLGIG